MMETDVTDTSPDEKSEHLTRRTVLTAVGATSFLGSSLANAVSGDTASYSEDCISFNREGLTIEQEGDQWLLTDGRSRMKIFEERNEAKRTVEIIHHYEMNEQCFVGRPNPSLEYWLVNGKAPTGSMSGGDDCTRFNPANLEVRQSSDRWRLVDNSHSLFAFPNETEARQARTIIQDHKFNRSCFVGRPNPSMTYLRRSSPTPEPEPPTTKPEPPTTKPEPPTTGNTPDDLESLLENPTIIGAIIAAAGTIIAAILKILSSN